MTEFIFHKKYTALPEKVSFLQQAFINQTNAVKGTGNALKSFATEWDFSTRGGYFNSMAKIISGLSILSMRDNPKLLLLGGSIVTGLIYGLENVPSIARLHRLEGRFNYASKAQLNKDVQKFTQNLEKDVSKAENTFDKYSNEDAEPESKLLFLKPDLELASSGLQLLDKNIVLRGAHKDLHQRVMKLADKLEEGYAQELQAKYPLFDFVV